MPRSGSRKCLNCCQFFTPNPRSKGRQKFCSCPGCQKASKRNSQQKWLRKPENRDYFCGKENVLRVQRWRKAHPGYWRCTKAASDSTSALQDTLTAQLTDFTGKNKLNAESALQEVLMAQPVVLIGLIAHLTGAALQEDIVETGRRLRQLGENFLHSPNPGDAPHAP